MTSNETKIEKGQVPMVAIDGARIRNIRETKKLTQLYVASVVGVTTDTISRWENNRYPSIKRDNAEKLATALEVEPEEILKKEEEPPPAPVEPVVEKKKLPRWLPLALLVLLIVVGTVLRMVAKPHVPTPASRNIPKYAAPGEVVPVQIRIDRTEATSTAGMIVKERLPQGWHKVRAIPEPAVGNGKEEELKWLIPPGTEPVVISYTLQVPTKIAAGSQNAIAGTVTLHQDEKNRNLSTGGSSTMIASPFHWADRNGDNRIDDDEIMPAYYLTEEMKGLGLDWKTIENIWNAGGYRFEKGKFLATGEK